MTTYSFEGFSFVEDFRAIDGEGELVSFATGSSFEIVVPETLTSFRYTYEQDPNLDPGEEPSSEVLIELDAYDIRLNGESFYDEEPIFTSIIDLDWIENGLSRQSTLLVMDFEEQGQDDVLNTHVFVLGGDSMGSITTLDQFGALFENSEAGLVESGTFAPNQDIALSALEFATTRENDLVTAQDFDQTLDLGQGDDTIFTGGGTDSVIAGDGNDQITTGAGDTTVEAGAGDDVISVGDSGPGIASTFLSTGTGDDEIVYDDFHNGEHYSAINFLDVTGINAQINGVSNFASVNKGTDGTVTIENVAAPMLSDGFGLIGSGGNDFVTLVVPEDGWASINTLAGDDQINVSGDGKIRIGFWSPNPQTGIVFDMTTGIVENDGYGGRDTITGQIDEIQGSRLADQISGTGHDEYYRTEGGNDTIDAADGVDGVDFDRNGFTELTFNMATGVATGVKDGDAFTMSLTNFEQAEGARDGASTIIGNDADNEIYGADFNDSLSGGAGNDELSGEGGDDTLSGQDGNDDLFGGRGNDLAFAGAGDDFLQGDDGNDTLYGAAGQDEMLGGDGDDLLGGGGDSDTLSGGGGNDALWTSTGDDFADGGLGQDTLGGAAGDDTLFGGDGADELWGAAGNDQLNGDEGNDTLGGSDGNDTLNGGDGADELWGAADDDVLMGGAGADTLGGAVGNDSLSGGDDADELWGADGMDTLDGGSGADQIGAGTGDDLALGGVGDDTVSGGLGADTLNGNEGNDVIFAADGDDSLIGGAGDDQLYGGAGQDSFLFMLGDGSDTVYASVADDTLQLDSALWVEDYDAGEVAQNYGFSVGDDFVLSFVTGETVTLVGLGSAPMPDIASMIEII